MGYFKTFSQLAEDLGGEIAQFADQAGEASIDFACNLWAAYPDRVTNNRSLGTSIIRGAMAQVCKNKQPPPLTVPPACEAQMLLFGTYTSKNLSAGGCDVMAWWRSKTPVPLSDLADNQPVEMPSGFVGHIGKSGTEYEISRITEAQFNVNDLVNQSGTNRIRFVAESAACLNQTLPGHGHSFSFEKVAQQNVLPETCNDDIQYPVTSPPPNLTQNYTISVGDQFQNYSVSLVYNPDGEFSFPLTFNWGGGLNITVDVGGVTFNNGDPNEAPSGDRVSGPNDDVGVLDEGPVDIGPPPDFPPFDPNDFNAGPPAGTAPEDELEEVEEEDALIEWILVSVVSPPKGGKTWVSTNAENVDQFAGFFSWTITADGAPYRLKDLPIRKLRHAFRAPDGVTGYTLYAVRGAKLKVTKYTSQ